MEKQRFWFGCVVAILGVAMMFIAIFIEPQGHISSSVLTGSGELLVFAGAILGLDGYIAFKSRKLYDQFINNKDEKDE